MEGVALLVVRAVVLHAVVIEDVRTDLRAPAALDLAAEAGLKGETALLALVIVGEAGGKPRPADYARIVAALRRAIAKVRTQGFALLDQELEPGVRSVAVPVHGPGGAVIAALNVGTHASRVTMDDLKGRVLPALTETAEAVSRAMGGAAG